MITRFNVRAYAIIIKDNRILLADETINDFSFTKFPGGGVELGEGVLDALRRELMEEGEIEMLDAEHLYTTDFFQASVFKPHDQIISVYYKVKADIVWDEKMSDQSRPDNFHSIRLYFYPLDELSEETLTFPIDKVVLKNFLKR